MSELESVSGDALTAAQVYGIWTIRDLVFAFEQHCDEPEVDGLDLLGSTHHLWLDSPGGVTSYLRVLTHEDVPRIGRVCTRREHRGQGLSGQLMRAVIDRWGDQETRLNAQAHLEGWYGTFGYVATGEHFLEAGIDHVPMARPAT